MNVTAPEARPALPIWRAVLFSALALVLALPGVVLTVLRLGPWEPGTPWPQLLSGYPLTLLPTLASVLAALLIGRRRRVRRAACAGVLLLLGIQLAVLAPRLVPVDGQHSAAPGAPGEHGRDLTVMSLNVGGPEVDVPAVMGAVAAHGVDILALPELGQGTLQRFESAGIAGLLPYRVTDVGGATVGNGIFSAFPLATPGPVPGSRFSQSRAVAQVPGIPGGIRLTSVHVNSPRPGGVPRWRKDLAELRELRRGAPPEAAEVLLGDFNASLDHRGLRKLLSAGGRRGPRTRRLPRSCRSTTSWSAGDSRWSPSRPSPSPARTILPWCRPSPTAADAAGAALPPSREPPGPALEPPLISPCGSVCSWLPAPPAGSRSGPGSRGAVPTRRTG